MAERFANALKLIYRWWADETVRAWVSQALVLGLVCSFLVVLIRTTSANIVDRGLASGFGFLADEAGFGIGETPPIPLLQGGFLAFIISVALGLFLCVLLGYWLQKNKGQKIGASTWSAGLAVFLVVGLPVIVLYLYGDDTRTHVYQESSSYGRALQTGVLNTIKVSLLGCILTSILGFLIGFAWVSKNWLGLQAGRDLR